MGVGGWYGVALGGLEGAFGGRVWPWVTCGWVVWGWSGGGLGWPGMSLGGLGWPVGGLGWPWVVWGWPWVFCEWSEVAWESWGDLGRPGVALLSVLSQKVVQFSVLHYLYHQLLTILPKNFVLINKNSSSDSSVSAELT